MSLDPVQRLRGAVARLERQHQSAQAAAQTAFEAAHRHAPSRSAATPPLESAAIHVFWRTHTGQRDWPVEWVHGALLARCLSGLEVDDWPALAPLCGRPVLFLANHQVAIETLLFALAVPAVLGRPVLSLAKREHRDSWLGRLGAHCAAYPGVRLPPMLAFFDRADPASLLAMADDLGQTIGREGLSLMVHAEGTRARACRQPVARLSSAILDLAVAWALPVVPVRFTGGLPVTPAPATLDFPLGFARQRIHLGRPLLSEALAPLPTGARRQAVLEALNRTGLPWEHEVAGVADPRFGAAVRALAERHRLQPQKAAVVQALAAHPPAIGLYRHLIAGLEGCAAPPCASAAEGAWFDGLLDWARRHD
ncbi:MAG: 1-acyl-sn-glycerol-3-phosphate acyltransferase [Pseudomonadota bacterium]